MNIKTLSVSIFLTFLVLFFNGSAIAAPGQGLAVKGISKQQAIAVVKQNFSGKILKVQLKETPKASFYKVKMLTKGGRVRQFRVDKNSGEILR